MRELDRRIVRIFVVDDNATHSTGIRQLIEMEPGKKVVGTATSGLFRASPSPLHADSRR